MRLRECKRHERVKAGYIVHVAIVSINDRSVGQLPSRPELVPLAALKNGTSSVLPAAHAHLGTTYRSCNFVGWNKSRPTRKNLRFLQFV